MKTKVVESRNREKRMKKKVVSEATFQKTVLTFLKKLPNVYAFKVIRANRSGVSDIVMCINGVFVSLELKKAGEKPTALQFNHLKEVNEAGGIGLWASPSNWDIVKYRLEELAYKLESIV